MQVKSRHLLDTVVIFTKMEVPLSGTPVPKVNSYLHLRHSERGQDHIFRHELQNIRRNLHNFFFSFLCGVRLSPLGTSTTVCPIVPTPDNRWCWMCSIRWNENWQGNPMYSENTCPNATLSTTNPTWPDLGSNPGHRCRKPATNRLSYGTALHSIYTRLWICTEKLIKNKLEISSN
jgi:hypothetical protein